jgi:hypothetical protein
MKRRYGTLFAIVLAIAVLLARVRAPHGAAGHHGAATAPARAETLSLVVENGAIAPAYASVPKGSVVHVHVACRGSAPVSLALAGYESRFSIPPLSPGSRWGGSFVADLPGDDFAWLLDGKPVARLQVTGSHLEEGHR